jgi:hypothetical protein
MEDAIRVLVIEDDIHTIYQKPDYNDGQGIPVSYTMELRKTQKFLSDTIVTRQHIFNFQPGMLRKYSVVMWIEGTDPDTTDDILGGMIKLQMNFSIVSDQ